MNNHFVVLGVHDQEVDTVSGNVLRVRMYVKGKEYDEDFDLPNLPDGSGIPKNVDTYTFLLTDKILARIQELEAISV